MLHWYLSRWCHHSSQQHKTAHRKSRSATRTLSREDKDSLTPVLAEWMVFFRRAVDDQRSPKRTACFVGRGWPR